MVMGIVINVNPFNPNAQVCTITAIAVAMSVNNVFITLSVYLAHLQRFHSQQGRNTGLCLWGLLDLLRLAESAMPKYYHTRGVVLVNLASCSVAPVLAVVARFV